MGAASKGIIQRGYQHNATMYSAPYARNPFDHVTDRDIAEYKRTVERKTRTGDCEYTLIM
jgi:adducin